MTDLTCASCGRKCIDAKHHAEEWRDRGHRPQVTREVDPQKANELREVMVFAPGRRP